MNNQPPSLLDITTLIAPIEGSLNGVGKDLTFDPSIDAITNARQADDPLLAQGDWVTDLKVADWEFVKHQCSEILINTSKDLKIALWYVDALSHTDHLQGINHGLQLLIALNKDYWLTMYPQIDEEEEGIDARAGLFSWFVKALSEDIKQLPLSDNSHHSYSYNDFLTARAQEKQRQKNPDSEIPQDVLLTDYYQAIRNSTDSWQQTLTLSLLHTAALWQELTEQLNDAMDMDAPVFSSVTELLTELTAHLSPLLPNLTNSDNDVENTVMEDSRPSNSNQAVDDLQEANATLQSRFNPVSRDHQSNRRQALKLLGQIEEYFAENEPHSPVTFLIKRAINWADMPLDQWLTHVIKNEDQLSILSDMIGINNHEEEGSG